MGKVKAQIGSNNSGWFTCDLGEPVHLSWNGNTWNLMQNGQQLQPRVGIGSVQQQPGPQEEEWILVWKDRATEQLTFQSCPGGPKRKVTHSKAMYHLQVGQGLMSEVGIGALEWERRAIEALDTYCMQQDPTWTPTEQSPTGLPEPYGEPVTQQAATPICICDIRVMMDEGCQCGAFKAEQRLKEQA